MQTSKPYQRMIVYDPPAYSNFYLFDIKSRLLLDIATKVKGTALLSPKANYAYWYSISDTTWFVYSVANDSASRIKGVTSLLTKKMITLISLRSMVRRMDHE